MDTWLPDLSDHNTALNDGILGWEHWSKWISFRVCDGTYKDTHFTANAAWTLKNDSEIIGRINYFVWPPSENNASWLQTFALFTALLETRSYKYQRKVVVMMDVESWRRWHHDMSNELNQLYRSLVQFLNSRRPRWQRNTIGIRRYFLRADRRRVIGYGNEGDLDTLWKNKPRGMRIVLANYTRNAPYKNKIIHQFSDHFFVPGLGWVDMNSADGLSPKQLAYKLGLVSLIRRII